MGLAPAGKERTDDAPEAVAAAPALPARQDARLAMASAMGNQAFTAYVTAGAGTIAREPTATATPTAPPGSTSSNAAPSADQQPGTWTAPMDYGTCTKKVQARAAVIRLRDDATELRNANFPEFDMLIEEATTWINGSLAGEGDLTAFEATQLTGFGADFKAKHDAAVRTVAEAIAAQFSEWLKPLSEEDLFDLREMVHKEFIDAKSTDLLQQATETLGKAEDLVKRVTNLTDWSNKLADHVKAAKTIKDLTKGVTEVKEKIGEIKEYVELARNVGVMLGKLGNSPAGNDGVASVEAGLEVMNFVIDKAGIPGVKALWSNYIYPVSKACLKLLGQVKELLYKQDREGFVRMFFDKHRGDAVAPKIDFASADGLAGAHIDDAGKHFPGGQPVFDFMWKLMRDEELTSVPQGVETYFVEFKDQMNAGEDDKNKIESDSHWYNAWNLFTTEHSPNLLSWLKANKQQAWTKLYGGMPSPSGG